jgi:signal transduction histidine kinase
VVERAVRVTNSGPGIPALDLPRVWERFYRVEKSRDRGTGGAGIGLAIVKRPVDEAGGTVGASSDAGATTFWFALPTT